MHDWTKDWYTIRYVLRRWWKWLVMAIFGLLLTPFVAWSATTLENPAPGSIKSGVGLISGWVCDAEELEVSFDGGPRQFVPYGSERTDTAGVCGDSDNGFGLLWNYNELGDGPHTVTLYADGIVQTQVNFNVRTLGTNFLRGVNGQGTISLSNGLDVTVQWEETTQGFAIVGYNEENLGKPGAVVRPTEDLAEFHFLVRQSEWSVEIVSRDDNLTGGGFIDFNFFDVVQEDGVPVVRGEVYDPATNYHGPLRLGRTPDLLPNSPFLHSYQYVLLLENYSSFLPSCEAMLFNSEDIVRGIRSSLDINIGLTIAEMEDGITCSLAEYSHWSPIFEATLHMEPY